MDNSFLTIFDIIALGCGFYCIITFVKLRIAGRLFPNGLLVPKDKKPKDCEDEAAYIAYLGPRLLILGIVTTLFGAVSMVNEYMQLYTMQVSLILTGVAFLTVVWYGVCTYRANKKYWGF